MAEIPYPTGPDYEKNNPLAQANSAMGFATHAQDLRQKMLMMRAHQAAGEHMQNSINPETGEADYNKFLVGISHDPRAALIAPEIVGTALAQKKTSYEILSQRMQNKQTELELVGKAFKPLVQQIAEGKDITAGHIAGAIGTLRSAGLIESADAGVKLFQSLEGPKPTKQSRANAVRSIVQLSQSGIETLNNTRQSMEKRFEQGEFYNPNSRMMEVRPMQEVTGQQGLGGMPGANPTGEGLAPPAPTGRTEGPGPSSTPPSALIKRPSESLQQYWTSKQELFNKNNSALAEQANAAANSNARIAEVWDAAKGFRTGPGQSVYGALGQFAAALGQKELGDRLRGGSVDARDEFNKYIIGITGEAMSQALGGVGGGHYSDFLLKSFQTGNPSEDTSPKAVAKILSFNAKMNRLIKERQKYVSKYEEWAANNGQVPDWGIVNRKWQSWIEDKKDPVTGELWLEVPNIKKGDKE